MGRNRTQSLLVWYQRIIVELGENLLGHLPEWIRRWLRNNKWRLPFNTQQFPRNQVSEDDQDYVCSYKPYYGLLPSEVMAGMRRLQPGAPGGRGSRVARVALQEDDSPRPVWSGPGLVELERFFLALQDFRPDTQMALSAVSWFPPLG